MTKKRGLKLDAPLVPGGNNFTAMHLDFRGLPRIIRLKMSNWCYFFAFLMGLPALCLLIPIYMMSSRLLKFNDWTEVAIYLFFLAFGCVFFGLAIWMVVKFRRRCRSFFDLSYRIFYPEGKQDKAISFSDFDSLQIIVEHCRGRKNNFDSFELNLVLKNGERFNLLDHSNKECLVEEAEMLSQKLSLPLNDAEGNRLNTDTFLNLSADIMQNLVFGTLLFLGGIILFASFTGHAYWMAKKSLYWKQTPALVEYAQIQKHSGKRTTYSLHLRYSYQFGGKKFTGNRYSFFSSTSSLRYKMEQIIRQHPAGQMTSCYVDPDAPKNAVISRHIPSTWELLWNSPFSLILTISGVVLLAGAARKKLYQNKRLRQKRGAGCSQLRR